MAGRGGRDAADGGGMTAAFVRRLRRFLRRVGRAYAPLAARGALFDGRADAGPRAAPRRSAA
uniref:Uncharacterized protein n=1 Tax=Mizugakiibacter sediminis TaxID=1475481 RepID=A0A0U1PC20_9GAMM